MMVYNKAHLEGQVYKLGRWILSRTADIPVGGLNVLHVGELCTAEG